MTTLVETSEEEPTLAVARAVAEIAWSQGGADIAEPAVAQYCEEAESYLIGGRYSDLANLLLTSADLVLAYASEKDMECIFTVICNLVSKAQSPDEALAMADQIANKLTAQPVEKPALCLKILFHLYNMLGNPYGRFLIFRRAVKLAIMGKVTDLIVPSIKRIDVFLREWNIGESDKRDLYLSATNILKDQKGSSKESYSFLVKYLATFAGEDALTLSEAKEEAVRAVIEFVKSPDMFQSGECRDTDLAITPSIWWVLILYPHMLSVSYLGLEVQLRQIEANVENLPDERMVGVLDEQCDLLDMPAVQQLSKDAKHAPVYRLLDIFLTSHLDAYLEFHSANAALLKNYGLVHEECITKVRLMSLAGLASKGSGEITYAVVRETLKVADDEVEYWIVRAIGLKLLEAKMDQLRQLVIISRCIERVFGLAQWRDLLGKLTVWKDNVNNVSRIIANAKASQNGLPQGLAATI